MRRGRPFLVDQVAEGPPLENLHDEVGTPLVDAEVAKRDDVRVRERAQHLRLALEAPAHELHVLEAVAEHLHGDLLPEPRVLGPVDDPDPSGAEHALDAVAAVQEAADERVVVLRRRRHPLDGPRGVRRRGDAGVAPGTWRPGRRVRRAGVQRAGIQRTGVRRTGVPGALGCLARGHRPDHSRACGTDRGVQRPRRRSRFFLICSTPFISRCTSSSSMSSRISTGASMTAS